MGKPTDRCITFDVEYVRNGVKSAGKNMRILSENVGMNKNALSACLNSGRIDKLFLRYLCAELGLDYDRATTLPEEKPVAPTGGAMDTAELIVSYIQDVGKINSDIVREVRETRGKTDEALLKLNGTLAELLALLRSMSSENRQYHTNINNKLVELNNRLTSGR